MKFRPVGSQQTLRLGSVLNQLPKHLSSLRPTIRVSRRHGLSYSGVEKRNFTNIRVARRNERN